MSTAVPSVGIFAGITMSTPYGLPSVFSSIQLQDRLELVGVVEPDAAEHAHPAGPGDRRGDLLRRGEREDRVVDAEAVAQLGAHQLAAPACLAWTSSAGRCSVCSLAHL